MNIYPGKSYALFSIASNAFHCSAVRVRFFMKRASSSSMSTLLARAGLDATDDGPGEDA